MTHKKVAERQNRVARVYEKRRNVLIEGLREAGWIVQPPKASMFVWAQIPEPFRAMGSLEFTKSVLQETQVALSPGIGFGPMGEGFVRFSLIEEDERVLRSTKAIGEYLSRHGLRPGEKLEPAVSHV